MWRRKLEWIFILWLNCFVRYHKRYILWRNDMRMNGQQRERETQHWPAHRNLFFPSNNIYFSFTLCVCEWVCVALPRHKANNNNNAHKKTTSTITTEAVAVTASFIYCMLCSYIYWLWNMFYYFHTHTHTHTRTRKINKCMKDVEAKNVCVARVHFRQLNQKLIIVIPFLIITLIYHIYQLMTKLQGNKMANAIFVSVCR
jgi:hypothetical protein